MILCRRFNLIAFSRSCSSWKTGLVDPTEENCHDAAQWIAGLVADGNTCTLEALQVVVNWFCHVLGRFIVLYFATWSLVAAPTLWWWSCQWCFFQRLVVVGGYTYLQCMLSCWLRHISDLCVCVLYCAPITVIAVITSPLCLWFACNLGHGINVFWLIWFFWYINLYFIITTRTTTRTTATTTTTTTTTTTLIYNNNDYSTLVLYVRALGHFKNNNNDDDDNNNNNNSDNNNNIACVELECKPIHF